MVNEFNVLNLIAFLINYYQIKVLLINSINKL